MKALSIYLISLFIFQVLYGQSNTDFKQIIEDAIRKRQDTGDVIYIDTALFFDPVIKNIFKKRSIWTVVNDSKRAKIILSKRERQSIVGQSKNNEYLIWPDSLFNRGRRVSYFDSIYITRGGYQIKYFAFSRPIFIKDNTVSLFEFVYMYGSSAGYKEIWFYRKGNKYWKRWVIITLGAW